MPAISEMRPDASWAPVAPFWAATARHELRFPQCKQCSRFQWYPRDFCAACRGHEFNWTRIATTGEVYSYTVVRRPFLPGSASTVPFTVLQVRFDEAPGVMLLSNLADESQALLVSVGARISMTFVDVGNSDGTDALTMPYVHIVGS